MKNSRTAGRTSAVDQRWLWVGINSLCRACSPLFQLLLSAGPSFNASSTVETKSVWIPRLWNSGRIEKILTKSDSDLVSRFEIWYRISDQFDKIRQYSAIFGNDLRSTGNSLTILTIIFLSILYILYNYHKFQIILNINLINNYY